MIFERTPGSLSRIAPVVLGNELFQPPFLGTCWRARSLSPETAPLIADLPLQSAFYHVHSFAAAPARSQDVLGTADYGETFASAVERGSFYGVQFHAEKSSAAGLRLLANFARICISAPALSHAGAEPQR